MVSLKINTTVLAITSALNDAVALPPESFCGQSFKFTPGHFFEGVG